MKKTKLVAAVVLLILYALFFFAASPNINPLYPDGLAFWSVVITTFAAVIFLLDGTEKLAGKFTHGKADNVKDFVKPFKHKRAVLVIIAIPWAAMILVGIYSLPFLHSSRYRDQMPQSTTRKFTSDMEPIDVNQLPVVDHDLAQKLADKKLGEKPALGSQVTLGDPTIQKVDGKLVWVVPLQHSGFFKWLFNMQGTPGYIIVSATDPRDVTYVDKYYIKYQPAAYLLDNLKRHTRLAGGYFTGLTDYSFELDDTGRPFWVVTTYKNLLGFGLPEASGVEIVDAQTGAAHIYSIPDTPKWVDRVQPEEYIMQQLNNKGKYVHGIFNFSNKDKYQTSDGHAIVYNNGRCYLFTCLTSIGSDESATGFVLVDMVTKQPYYYPMSGATEYAAQRSAEGKVQNLKYQASFPLITNVDGTPTYFMTLKDNAGLIKQYAFVPVGDYTTVGTGSTIQDALDDLRHTIRGSSDSSGIEAGEKKQTVEDTIARFASENQNGSTQYEFILQGNPGKIYTASYDVSSELALTKEGDKVKISFEPDGNGLISITSFTNETIGQKK